MRAVLLGAALSWFIAAPASAATFTGVAQSPSVVWVTDVPPAETNGIEIRQTMKAFVPALVVVPVGGSVTFPNDDPFYHSVYSDSAGNAFDLGLYDTGPGKNVSFPVAGIVDVRCHVHGSMHATIVVVDGPYAQTRTAGERFRIDGISAGRHTVHTWTADTGLTTATVVTFK